MEHHQRAADWGEGHLLPVWAIHDGTLRDIDVLLKIENLGAMQLPVVLQKPEAFMRQQCKLAVLHSLILVVLLSVMLYAISLLKFLDTLALTLFVAMLSLQWVVLCGLSGLAQFLVPALTRSHTAMTSDVAVWLWLMLATWHTRLSISMYQLPINCRNGLVYAAIGCGVLGMAFTFQQHLHAWPAYVLLTHAVVMCFVCAWQCWLQPRSKNLSYAAAWAMYALSVGVYLMRHKMSVHPSNILLFVCGLSVSGSLLLVWAHCSRWMGKLTMLRAALKQSLLRSRWVAVAQHDLWQPLQSMQLYANALVWAAPEQWPRMVKGLQLAAGNAVECMRHLQDWYELQLSGKSQSDMLQAVSADAVLRPLVAECLAMAQSHCINLRYCRNSSVLMTNPVAVQRIVRNLIHNALTYTPAGGKVLIGCRRKNDHLWIYCIDNGPGMTDHQVSLCSQAHQRFSHTENSSHKHQGLGLYSVREMAAQLGLQLHIKSKPAKGSVFAVGVRLALQPLSTEVLLLGHVV
jgi:signal transduction histidine kinase